MQIYDTAWHPVRSFLVEYAVAAWREACGGNPSLIGGRRRGHDVQDGDMLIDAKTLVPASPVELRRLPGHDWKVARDRHALFDPGTTTHLALVALPDDMVCDVDDDGERVVLSLTRADIAIYVFAVEEFNSLLDPERAERERWRYLHLETAWLDRHRVL